MKRICRICGKTFETCKNELFCSPECRRENHRRKERERHAASYEQRKHEKPLLKMRCEECGKEFTTRNSTQRFCSAQCSGNYHRPKSTAKLQPKLSSKARSKSLDDWCKEAAECNLDYGNYRALIESGKTFDELKTRADSQGVSGHSHHRKVAW